MLDSKSRDQTQKPERHNLQAVPAGIYRSGTASISLLPKSSNVSSRSTRVAVDQITWPDRSIEIGGAWKVCSLIPGSEDCAVSTGRNSRPSRKSLAARGKRQGVFCVDHLDCVPRDVMGAKNVDHSHAASIDFNSRSPIQVGNKCDDKGDAWRGEGEDPKSLAYPNTNQGHKQNDRDHDRNELSESGFKDLHHTNLSLGAIA